MYVKTKLGAAACLSAAMFDDDNDLPMADVADMGFLLGMFADGGLMYWNYLVYVTEAMSRLLAANERRRSL